MAEEKLTDEKMMELGRKIWENGGRMGKMPFGQFLMTVGTTPVLSVELVIQTPEKSALLIWREDQDFTGWHFPGSLVSQFEQIKQAAGRIAKKEADLPIKNPVMIGFRNFNNPEGDPRHWPDGTSMATHFAAPVVVVEPDIKAGTIWKPEKGEFFDQMPADILGSHRAVWDIWQQHLADPRPVRLFEE